jgi:amino acid adenylation domain-containing protein
VLDAMFATYGELLRGLAAGPARWAACAGRLVPAAERAVQAAANATAGPEPTALLHEAIAARAAEAPAAEAVVSGAQRLTYAEVEARANRVGRALRARGARPNTLVAVVMEKGWEQVVAALGVVKAGAAYLPVDPEVPAERLRYVLENGEVGVALTQRRVAERVAWPAGVEWLCVDEEAPWAAYDGEALASVQGREDLAYVIYTSGSTGQPKGVEITHRGAHNTLADMTARFGVGRGDRVLGLSSLSFDLSVYDIFGTLGAGATVVLPEAGRARDPGHWVELLERERVTVWNSVPALMELLVECAEGRPEGIRSAVRTVWLSGDWIAVSLPARIRRVLPGAEVVSLGGATEASIWSIAYPIEAVGAGWRSIPYGWPLRNQTFHVLDEAGEPCPAWVTGELYIGGVGVARGYWRDAERTAARFVREPASGAVRYRTGDLGRYWADGTLEFLGREDQQVKVHGYRIELGEIEAALGTHAGVREAVVAAVGPERGARRLVAYVVPTDPPAASDAGALAALADAPLEQRAPDGVLLDPLARLEWKLAQPGLRRDDGTAPVALATVAADAQAWHARRSHRRFLETAVALTDLSALLACLAQRDGDGLPKYRYGSAGGLYPVQTYVYVKPGRVEDVPPGLYYCDPCAARLVPIGDDVRLSAELYAIPNRALFEGAAFGIYLVGKMSAIRPMYGDLARDFCLLEAGAMAQLLETVAAEHGLGLCQTGAVDAAAFHRLAVLDDDHAYLHGLVGGRVDPAADGRQPRSSRDAKLAAPCRAEAPLFAELRSHLERQLPAYMIPSAFVVLERVPLTANGKVDRRALPAPDQAPAARFVEPVSELEQLIASVWQDILNLDRVGVEDNFFDLGADSMAVVRAHNRLQQRLDIAFPVVTMFHFSTIRALAAQLAADRAERPAFPEAEERARRRRTFGERQRERRARHRIDPPRPGELHEPRRDA